MMQKVIYRCGCFFSVILTGLQYFLINFGQVVMTFSFLLTQAEGLVLFFFCFCFCFFFQNRWFQGKWPNDIGKVRSIAWMELFPIIVSVVLWGHLLIGNVSCLEQTMKVWCLSLTNRHLNVHT